MAVSTILRMTQVLVAGASGLVGRGTIRAYADSDVIAVSRRAPDDLGGVRFISVDLFDERACREAFSQLTDVTHLVYTALYEKEN